MNSIVKKALLTLSLVGLLTASAVADSYLYVVNSIGETLSRINRDNGSVDNNLISLGSDINSAPNQLVVRDTLAYVVCSVTDEIQVIDLNSSSTVGFISLPAGSNPYWLACYNDTTAYVSLLANNGVAKIDLISRTVVDQFPVGKSPAGLAIARHKLYVVNSGFDFGTFTYDPGTVTVYDIGPDTLVETIATGLNPQFVDRDRQGRLHVVCTGNYSSVFGAVYLLDPAADEVVDSVLTGGSPGQIAIGPDNIAYLAAGGFTEDGFVFSYDAGSGAVYHASANPLAVDQNCLAVTASADSTVYAASFTDFVQRIDSSGAELNRYAVGDGPIHQAPAYRPGDVNGDFEVDLSDIIYLVNSLFLGGPPPAWPAWRANVNGDFNRDLADVIHLVNYSFLGGPAPKVGPTWIQQGFER
ncbi:hypothetical protein GF420_01320 [candidate division GN15 bacterium]|nr:hypothetical protein [candidate division GN15 bacterium]